MSRLRTLTSAALIVGTLTACGSSSDGGLTDNGSTSGGATSGAGGAPNLTPDSGTPGPGGTNGGNGSANGGAAAGAQPLGAACVLGQELDPTFAGFSASSVAFDPSSAACESGLCLANHFQGRVSCPYGQPGQMGNPTVPKPDGPGGTGERCMVPGTGQVVEVVVEPQLVERRPDVSVYCSCRCAGPNPAAEYCQCPAGLECTELVPATGGLTAFPVGSYCIKPGTDIDGVTDLPTGRACEIAARDCGPNNSL